MNYGIVIRNITDLRARALFQSERKSQFLYNEPVTIGRTKNGYCRVYQEDGYNGWVDRKALLLMNKPQWWKYIRNLNHRVTSKTVSVTNREYQSVMPPFLFFSTLVNVLKKDKHYAIIGAPDGSRFRLALSKLWPISDIAKRPANTDQIIRFGRRLRGVPYLWGGMTPFGIDCSGLVQILYRMQGIALPRDSRDQRQCGVKIAQSDICRGDLLFFEGHVAIAVDRYKILHSSLAEGGVAISSLKPDDSNFRPDLADSFICARRVTK